MFFLPVPGLNALTSLYLSDNQISTLGESLGSLKKLKHLNAQRNAIYQVHPSIMAVQTLEVFDFEGNPVPLNEVPGYGDYFERRKKRVDKGIQGGVQVNLLNERPPDEQRARLDDQAASYQ